MTSAIYINNFLELDKSVACGARPESPSDFESFSKKYVQVLNLERGWFEFFHGIQNRETRMTIDYGMIPVAIEMSDFTPPTFDELDCALKIIDVGTTYFHCLHGKDRTGMVRATYRVKKQNWTVEAAVKEMLEMGMHFVYRPFWIPHLKEYLQQRGK